MPEYKNSRIVEEIFDSNQVKYATWIYDEEYDIYFDIVLTDRFITVIGKDIIDTQLFTKISHGVAYFGDNDDDYSYNCWNYDIDWNWSYGDGEIVVYFTDWSGNDYTLLFQQGRFMEAQRFLSNCVK